MTPAKTPVALPRRDAGSMPARSNASHDVSSSTRCCGSVATASRGLIPKKSASKSAAPSREAPLGGVGLGGGGGVGAGRAGHVPAAVRGEGGDGVAARGEQTPQVLGGGHAAGVAAGHADDGDRLVLLLLLLAQPPAGVAQF